MKEAQPGAGRRRRGAQLRIVPLFEAGATLAGGAARRCDTLLATPVYREALRAVGDEQEIMIGYSDSNKDVGYLASAGRAYRAQVRIAEVLREHGVGWMLLPRPGRRGRPRRRPDQRRDPGAAAGHGRRRG